jgi:acyl carrier protein
MAPVESSAPRSTFSDELASFIEREVSPGDDRVSADTDLVMSGLVDSLGVVMIVEWIERRLDIAIDPTDVVVEHFSSIDAVVDYLRGRGDCSIG